MQIAFVCQAGPLALRSVLLAASLKANLGSEVTLLAGVPCPAEVWSQPTSAVRAALDELGVATCSISQQFQREYPIANKISALDSVGNGPALLLDSDVLCLSPPPLAQLRSVDVAAKPSDMLSFNPGFSGWRRIYETLGVPPPARRVVTTVSCEVSYPYFNSGVVYAKNASDLARAWMRICEHLYGCNDIQDKFPWLDQIAFPIAIERLRWTSRCLTDQWNFPAHLRAIPQGGSMCPYFVHYHNAVFFPGSVRQYVRSLIKGSPRLESVIHEAASQPQDQLAQFLLTL